MQGAVRAKPSKARIRRQYIDWFFISKRSVYATAGVIFVVVLALGIGWYLKLYGNQIVTQIENWSGPRVVRVSGSVTIRRGTTNEVVPATLGMILNQGDTIQTGADSTAVVQYDDNSRMYVRGDSTVIVKESSRDSKQERQRIKNEFVNGVVRVSAGETPNSVDVKSNNVNVNPKSVVTITADAGEDKSQVTVETGTATVRTGEGKAETLAQNTQTDYQKGVRVGQVALLPPPKLKSPDNASLQPCDPGDRPELVFSWSGLPDAARYRIQISDSTMFEKAGTETFESAIPLWRWSAKSADGTYYWRVQAIAKNSKEGVWSAENKFSIVVRPAPKGPGVKISIGQPEVTRIDNSLCEIAGTTEPGVQLRINGKLVLVDNQGKYTAAVDLRPGQKSVNLQARDAQGRTGSRVVTVN